MAPSCKKGLAGLNNFLFFIFFEHCSMGLREDEDVHGVGWLGGVEDVSKSRLKVGHFSSKIIFLFSWNNN